MVVLVILYQASIKLNVQHYNVVEFLECTLRAYSYNNNNIIIIIHVSEMKLTSWDEISCIRSGGMHGGTAIA